MGNKKKLKLPWNHTQKGRIYFSGSSMKLWLSNRNMVKLILRIQNYTSVSPCGCIHTIFCFQNMCALSQVFIDGSSQHLSPKINTALLSSQQKGERVTESETFRNTYSALLSFTSIRAAIPLLQHFKTPSRD